MPEQSPIIKVEAVKSLGAEVLLFGENIEQAHLKAREISQNENTTLAHPYNDETIIAGQGTVGLEIIDELPEIGTVIVPIGGGGLISGISLALTETAEKRKINFGKVIGVRSKAKIAEGIRIKEIGKIPQVLINKYVYQQVIVGEEEIALAILMLMEKSKLVVEGAGAVGLAALLCGKIEDLVEPVIIVLSGGNIDINLVGKIIKKGLHGLDRMTSLAVEVEDRPGNLAKLTSLIAAESANIYKIDHERSLPNLSLTKSRVIIVLETWNKEHVSKIIDKLELEGYQVKEM